MGTGSILIRHPSSAGRPVLQETGHELMTECSVNRPWWFQSDPAQFRPRKSDHPGALTQYDH